MSEKVVITLITVAGAIAVAVINNSGRQTRSLQRQTRR